MSSEPERWISFDREVVESASWTVRSFPGEREEPAEEVPEPVAESAPVAEPPPAVPAQRPPARRKARARRTRPAVVREAGDRGRRPLALASVLVAGVILFAGTVGSTVAFVLKWPPASSQRNPPPPPDQRAQPEARGHKKAVAERPSGDPVVVAAGDIACDPLASTFMDGLGTEERCRQAATADLVQELDPDAVLVLGDVQYEDGQYWKYMRSYGPTWGRFKGISHPTPSSGHDRFGGGGYRRYWGDRAGPEGRPWYSFEVGDWHVVSLDSNCSRAGGCEPGSPQERWLRADLAANQAACTLAFWHEPRFSSSKRTALEMAPIWQALYDFRAEIVLSGDAHNYERFRPQDAAGRFDGSRGIRQFVVGTGGKSLVPFEGSSAGSRFRYHLAFGVLELTLHPKRYDWRFVPVSGEAPLDPGSGHCH